jgi:hypothetical protein
LAICTKIVFIFDKKTPTPPFKEKLKNNRNRKEERKIHQERFIPLRVYFKIQKKDQPIP